MAEGVVGRFKAVPNNLKSDFEEFKNKSFWDALSSGWGRFGQANREMVKTVGSGVRR